MTYREEVQKVKQITAQIEKGENSVDRLKWDRAKRLAAMCEEKPRQQVAKDVSLSRQTVDYSVRIWNEIGTSPRTGRPSYAKADEQIRGRGAGAGSSGRRPQPKPKPTAKQKEEAKEEREKKAEKKKEFKKYGAHVVTAQIGSVGQAIKGLDASIRKGMPSFVDEDSHVKEWEKINRRIQAYIDVLQKMHNTIEGKIATLRRKNIRIVKDRKVS